MKKSPDQRRERTRRMKTYFEFSFQRRGLLLCKLFVYAAATLGCIFLPLTSYSLTSPFSVAVAWFADFFNNFLCDNIILQTNFIYIPIVIQHTSDCELINCTFNFVKPSILNCFIHAHCSSHRQWLRFSETDIRVLFHEGIKPLVTSFLLLLREAMNAIVFGVSESHCTHFFHALWETTLCQISKYCYQLNLCLVVKYWSTFLSSSDSFLPLTKGIQCVKENV